MIITVLCIICFISSTHTMHNGMNTHFHSAFRITTDTDLTSTDDAKDKCILLSVSNVSDLHHIFANKKTVPRRHRHTVTLPRDNGEWMNGILIYILGLNLWNCSLAFLNVDPSATFSSIIAIVETKESTDTIMQELQTMNTNNKKRLPTSNNANASQEQNNSPGKKIAGKSLERKAVKTNQKGSRSPRNKAGKNARNTTATDSPYLNKVKCPLYLCCQKINVKFNI